MIQIRGLLFWFALGALGLGLMMGGRGLPLPLPQAEAAGTVDLLFVPVPGMDVYRTGRPFAFDLVMRGGAGTYVQGVEAKVLFNQEHSRMVALEKTSSSPLSVLVKSPVISNDIGEASLALGTLSTPVQLPSGGELAFARATFLAVSEDASASLSFSPSNSRVAYGGGDITRDCIPFSFSIDPSSPVVGSGGGELILSPGSVVPGKLYQTKNVTLVLSVSADAGQYVDGVACHLNYDPSCFSLVSPPNVAACPLKQVIRNGATAGQIDLVLGATPGTVAPKGSFPVATFTLQAKEGGETRLWFVRDPGRWTDLTDRGASILHAARDGVYEIAPLRGIFRVKVGRTGGKVANLPLRLRVAPESHPTSWDVRDLVTDGAGTVEVPLDYFGPYRVQVRKNWSLWRVRGNVVSNPLGVPPVLVDMGNLQEGDANEDNRINILDFSIMAATFGKKSTDSGFNPRGDFNEDGIVNVADYSLVSSYFGQYCEAAAPEKPVVEDSSGESGGGCSAWDWGSGAWPLCLPLVLLMRRRG